MAKSATRTSVAISISICSFRRNGSLRPGKSAIAVPKIYRVKYAATGTQNTKTVENRVANGNFKTVLVETPESTQAPHTQHATLPSHNP